MSKNTTELLGDVLRANGGNPDSLPDKLRTTYLRAIYEASGGNPDELPDNLEVTLLKGIAELGGGGGNTGGGGSDLDALIDGSLTEVTSNATKIVAYKFRTHTELLTANFPRATEVGDSAFYGCTNLTTISCPKVVDVVRYGFRECKKLISANFPQVVSSGISTFQDCLELQEALFPKLEDIASAMFYGCSKLAQVNFSSATNITNDAFYGCKGLIKMSFPKVVSSGATPFYKCEKLEHLDFSSIEQLGNKTFNSCYSLKKLILRTSGNICTTSSDPLANCYHFLGTKHTTYNPNGDKDGYVYVPKALLSDDDETKDYRRATNWSNYANQFRALEDYTVDGTITGELDESKI